MDYIILKYINSFAGKFLWLDVLGIIITDFLFFSLPLIIFLAYFVFNKKRKFFNIFLKIILGLVLVASIGYLISQIVGRSRPFLVYNDIYQLSKFNMLVNDFSFPSFHTANSFVLAIIVFYDWKNFGLILLFFAFLIGISRVFVGVHFLSDIIAGIVLAIICAFLTNHIFSYLFNVFQNKTSK